MKNATVASLPHEREDDQGKDMDGATTLSKKSLQEVHPTTTEKDVHYPRSIIKSPSDAAGAAANKPEIVDTSKRIVSGHEGYPCKSARFLVATGEAPMTWSAARPKINEEATCNKTEDQPIPVPVPSMPFSPPPKTEKASTRISASPLESFSLQELTDYIASFKQTPGQIVAPLVVRVVSSAIKELKVRKKFFDTFKAAGYAEHFLYKSKMLLLFQKIEGVDVCLFGMYVHEFDSDCPLPNQRHIHLAYLDSVSHFRAEIKTENGRSLRTFVYHEILIGYLDYCQKRGFTKCYLWACPPVEGDDYIFFCHPPIQKTLPFNTRLVQLVHWYTEMFQKAISEGIAKKTMSLCDYIYHGQEERPTAVQLPYFEGDFVPEKAEDILTTLDGKETTWTKDSQLMEKLKAHICKRQQFFILHLQYMCSHCREFILSGTCSLCRHCNQYVICERCFATGLHLRPNVCPKKNGRHYLFSVRSSTTKNIMDDKITINNFFDERESFLDFCRRNHYQFDTLRRAKHTTIMLLYHLLNPTAPTFPVSFDGDEDNMQASTALVNEPKDTSKVKNQERKDQKQDLKKRLTFQLLAHHAFKCKSTECKYANCQKIQQVYNHAKRCRTRAEGGCERCTLMWNLLQMHARACKEAGCDVDYCKYYKEKLRQRAELRRHAAVTEMMASQEEEEHEKH